MKLKFHTVFFAGLILVVASLSGCASGSNGLGLRNSRFASPEFGGQDAEGALAHYEAEVEEIASPIKERLSRRSSSWLGTRNHCSTGT